MFTRTFALATALSTAGALSAYAESTVGEDVTNKGQVLENAAEVSEDGTTSVDKETYSDDGNDIVVISRQTTAEEGEGVVDEAGNNERAPGAASTSAENVLSVAEPGEMIYTVQGDPVGTVSYKEDQGAAGYLVFVDVHPAANLQVPTVGIQVKSLQTTNDGSALEYAFSIDYLRDRIQDALDKS